MRILITLMVVAALVILGISIYLQPHDLTTCRQGPTSGNCGPVDAIVVVSGGDTVARTKTGIELYKKGWSQTLIFSGAALDKSGPSNAAAMREIAVEAGVSPEYILIDESSETTIENAANTGDIVKGRGYEKIILVTSGYHQRRAFLEFQRRAPDVRILNFPTNDRDWSGWWWLTPRGWYLASGELVKIAVTSLQGGFERG